MKSKKYSCPFHYIGGKSKLLSQILPVINSYKPDLVVDLFAGGFSVGLNCYCKQIICNDKNQDFIELLKWIYTTRKEDLLASIESEIEHRGLTKENEKAYKDLRNDYNKKANPLLLFLLISYSFNHQMRYNNDNEFNTPFGKARSSYNKHTKQSLSFFSDKIQSKNVSFSSLDFANITLPTGKVLFFVDPPYFLSTGSYNDGNRGIVSWNENDEKRLYAFLNVLNQKGIAFVLTNFLSSGKDKNIQLAEFAKKYHVSKLDSNYSNANYHKRKKEQTEIMVRNFI